jgi:hypothetical protein
VLSYDCESGEPLLAALVVRGDTGEVGGGFVGGQGRRRPRGLLRVLEAVMSLRSAAYRGPAGVERPSRGPPRSRAGPTEGHRPPGRAYLQVKEESSRSSREQLAALAPGEEPPGWKPYVPPSPFEETRFGRFVLGLFVLAVFISAAVITLQEFGWLRPGLLVAAGFAVLVARERRRLHRR